MADADKKEKQKQSRVSQADVPAHSLSEAIRVAQVIADEFARQPAKPLHLAEGLNIKPGSSRFRMLTGAALAYGLTTGAYGSPEIGLTDLGKRCVAPTVDGDDVIAQREALLRPRVLSEFLTKYDSSKMPSEKIAVNVLVDMGIALERAKDVFEMIKESAHDYGLTREIKGEVYIDLGGQKVSSRNNSEDEKDEVISQAETDDSVGAAGDIDNVIDGKMDDTVKKVFVTHGRNKEIAQQLKELLTFGKFEPVLAVEHETVAKPVPQKVMDDMRSCNAAVIHVGQEQTLLDSKGEEVKILNPNVLIEIGAAMALYGQKFILLVEKGTELPSNLQGLYEVRYEGDKLDYEATMKLLKAFNDISS